MKKDHLYFALANQMMLYHYLSAFFPYCNIMIQSEIDLNTSDGMLESIMTAERSTNFTQGPQEMTKI